MIFILKSKTRDWFERQRLVLTTRSIRRPLQRVVGKAPLLRGEDPLPGRYPFRYRWGGLRFSRELQKRIEGGRGLDRVPPPPYRRVVWRGVLPPSAPSRLRQETVALLPPPLLNPPPLYPAPFFGYRQLVPTLIRRGRGGYPIYRAKLDSKSVRRGGRGRRRKAIRQSPLRAGWVGRWLGVRLFVSSRRRPLPRRTPRFRVNPPRGRGRNRGRSRRRNKPFRKRVVSLRFRKGLRLLIRTVRAVYSSPLLPRFAYPLLTLLGRTLANRAAVRSLPPTRRVAVRRLLRAASSLCRLRPPSPFRYPPFRLKRGVLRLRTPLLPPSSLLPLLPPADSWGVPALLGRRGKGVRSRLRLRFRPLPVRVVRLWRQLKPTKGRRRPRLSRRWGRWSRWERRLVSTLLSYSEYDHASA